MKEYMLSGEFTWLFECLCSVGMELLKLLPKADDGFHAVHFIFEGVDDL